MPKTFLASGVGPPGQYNLRGKKVSVARCGCCDIFDFRGSHKTFLDKKEMRKATIASVREEEK